MKPNICTSVLSEHKEITSHDQVLASTTRHEQAQALEVVTKKAPRHKPNVAYNLPIPKVPKYSTTTITTHLGPRRVEEHTHTRVVERTYTPLSILNTNTIRCFRCN